MFGAMRRLFARKRPRDDEEGEGEEGAKRRHAARARARRGRMKAAAADACAESGAVDGSAGPSAQGCDQGATTTHVARRDEDTSGVARAVGESTKKKKNKKKNHEKTKKTKKTKGLKKKLHGEDRTWHPERVDEEQLAEDVDEEELAEDVDEEELAEDVDEEPLAEDVDEDELAEDDYEEEFDEDSASGHLARWRGVKVEQSLVARRQALEERLKRAISEVDPSKIYAHQREAAMILANRFCSGSPGCLFVLDCGLGKTHTLLVVAGALVQVGVRVVVASENLLLPELKRIFADLWPELEPDALDIICSGHQPIHKKNAKDAFAQRAAEDAVFIVDEASRYSDEEGAMHEAISESVADGYHPFRILVTATPFTSTFAKLGSLVQLTGIASDGERDDFKKEFMFAARCFASAAKLKPLAEICSSGELQDFLDEITVGRRALEKVAPNVIADLIAELADRVRMQVRVLTIPTPYPEEHWTRLIATIATRRPRQLLDIVTKCELSDALASHFAHELGLEPLDDDDKKDATVKAIVELILSMAQEGVVVYVPSDLAAGAWYIWARLIAILGPSAVAVIDQDTDRDERQRIIHSFDEPVHERQYKVLFATTETSGFGINLPTVDNAVLLTSSWTASTNAQATHRNVRAFSSAVSTPRTKRLVLVMFLTGCGSLALSRLSRAAFRGKCGASLFPPLLPIDELYNLPILATSATPLTVDKRNACKISDLVTDGIVMRDYSDFLLSISELASSTTSIEFLFAGDNSQQASKPRKSVAKSSASSTRGAGTTSGGGLKYRLIRPKNEAERAVLAGIATSHAVPVPAARSVERARLIEAGIARAQISLERGETWRPSSSQDFCYLFPKVVTFDAPERRMMITASSLSSSSLFPKKPIKQTPQMLAGLELEAAALDHVSKKYGFKMVPNVDRWTRALPSDPTFLAATLDGLTTEGVIVELKFVHAFMDVLTPAGAIKKYNKYMDQVQAQLCVFELPLAMLVFYSIDAHSGNMFSCEYWIHRDDDWLARNKDRFDDALANQRQKFGFDPNSL